MLKMSYFTRISTQRRLRHLSYASLMTLLLKTMSDIDQALLQFIDVINLVDLLLYFSASFVVNRVQSAVGCERCGEMKAGLVAVVPGG